MTPSITVTTRFYGSLADRKAAVEKAWATFIVFRRERLSGIGAAIGKSDRPNWWDAGQAVLREVGLFVDVGWSKISTLESPYGGRETYWLQISPLPEIKHPFFSLRIEAEAPGSHYGGMPQALALLLDHLEAMTSFT